MSQGADAAAGVLAGRHVLVTAGPTWEDIDPVRFIGNRSSGRMGFAVAAAARAAGARVTLVAGPVALQAPDGVQRVDVRSAAQMHEAVMAALPADVYVGAAAVADFRPASVAAQKIKKQPGGDGLVLELVRTRDILAEVAVHPSRPALVVGFAAETTALEANALAKLRGKKLDLVCANRVGIAGSGFESADNTLEVYWDGGHQRLGPGPKTTIAMELLGLVAARLAPLPGPSPRSR